MIDSSDEDKDSSAEESVESNSLVSKEVGRGGRAAALRNPSGTSSKSSTVRMEETVENGLSMIKL